MSAAADFDVSSWLTGEKSVPFSSASSVSNDSLYAPLSIHVPDTKTMDHQLGLFSPLLLNEPQSMNLQTPTGPPSAVPFPFHHNDHDNDNIKMENDSSVDEQPTNNQPAFDHGLSMNSSIPTNVPPVVDHLSSSHLSPLSDASSPSDFEVDRFNPISPLSPSISGTHVHNGYYQSVDQIFEDDDYQSPSTSPASPASSEISALSESTVNANSTSSTIHSSATDNNQQPKSSKTGGKKKRAKRRNLLNALKEHLASSTTNANNHSSNGEEGTSESESELMHELTNRSTRTRGKRSASSVADGDEDKDDPASKRERNKQSASAYRKRRKMYLDTLESKVEVLNEKLTEQQQSMAKMENENKVLREQVSFLKRLISFKTANNESETKESDDNAMHISSSSSSSYSSGAFGATNSRLNLLNYSTTRSTNAGMFLFLLFSCFLLFNPMWSNDLSINNDGSSVEPVGRISRKLLSYEDLSDPLNAAVYSSVKKEDYMNTYFYGFPTQSTETVLNPETSASSSSAAARSKNNHSEDVPLSSSSPSSPSSSSSSSVRYPLTEVSDDARSKALAQLHSLAASFQMDPQSQQFAELVAASYLPLVNILGEAATRAALQELATGVFFLQHQTLLTAITAASDTKRNNSTAVPHS